MPFFNVDENGNRTEISRQQAVSDFLKLMAQGKKEKKEKEQRQAEQYLRQVEENELARINKANGKREIKVSVKDTIIKKIIDFLISTNENVVFDNSKNLIYIHRDDADYEIKVTKKKERVSI